MRFIIGVACIILALTACHTSSTKRASATQVLLDSRNGAFVTADGLRFRDLNRNAVLDPYEDWRLNAASRATDLVQRLTLEEKAGLMMHGTAPTPGSGFAAPGAGYDLDAAQALILTSGIKTLITRLSLPPDRFAAENNKLQEIAERGRHGIPVTISSDPRNQFSNTIGATVEAGSFTKWPAPLGFASIGDAQTIRQFGDFARQEYRAVGIHMALSPQADLATEPRWPRIDGTFGENPALVGRMVRGYIAGFQNGEAGLNPQSVAAVVKHWVGYGASATGFDSHNSYARHASFAGGRFADHVRPFEAAFDVKVAGVMPTYSILQGVTLNGATLEPVGGGFNSQLLTGLLRKQHRFSGVVISDWGITNDCDRSCLTGDPVQKVQNIGMPWGVDNLTTVERFAKGVNAGLDQFGGTSDAAALVSAIQTGAISVSRIDESVQRILEQTFQLGLFDNPYVDPQQAALIVGKSQFQDASLDAQRRSLVLLETDAALLPVRATGAKVFLHNISASVAASYGFTVVTEAAQADVAILRVAAPYQKLHEGFFFGSRHHEGSLDFDAASPDLALIEATSRAVPTIVVVLLDRPAILTRIKGKAHAVVAEFGTSDAALLDVLTGKVAAQGRLPFELPSSMQEVEQQSPDKPHDTRNPLYPIFYGLAFPTVPPGAG